MALAADSVRQPGFAPTAVNFGQRCGAAPIIVTLIEYSGANPAAGFSSSIPIGAENASGLGYRPATIVPCCLCATHGGRLPRRGNCPQENHPAVYDLCDNLAEHRSLVG